MDKQYTILVNEMGRALLERIFQSGIIDFLELQGANLNNEGKFNILLTPVLPPLNQMKVSVNAQPSEEDVTKDPTV